MFPICFCDRRTGTSLRFWHIDFDQQLGYMFIHVYNNHDISYLYKLHTVLPFLLQFLCRIRLFKAFAAGILAQRILKGFWKDPLPYLHSSYSWYMLILSNRVTEDANKILGHKILPGSFSVLSHVSLAPCQPGSFCLADAWRHCTLAFWLRMSYSSYY